MLIVEGQTEQTFVRDILAPELGTKSIFLCPALIGKPGHKGGNKFETAQNDIGRFLKQRNDTYVSTFFDFFRLDPHWPGLAKAKTFNSSGKRAEHIEKETHKEIARLFPKVNVANRFIPFVAMYEFEALLFSNASTLADKINVKKQLIDAIRNEYNSPEEINDGPKTAPSKRLITLCPGYRKIAMGKDIAEAIGIQTIRAECPHFDSWLGRLEGLPDLTP